MVWINLFSIWIVINFTTTYRMMIHFVTFYFQPQGSNVTIMMYGITGLNPNNKYAVLIFLCVYVHRTFEHKKPNVILWKSLYKRKEVFFYCMIFYKKLLAFLDHRKRRFTTESSFNRSNDREIMSICLWSLIGQYSEFECCQCTIFE